MSYSGTTAMFTPAIALAYSTSYTATITTGAKDLAGLPVLADYVWTFTTGAVPDTTAPFVSASVPADGASSVAINATVSALFSEAMDPSTINTTTFTLKDSGNNPISGTVSYAAGTATFTPAAALGSSVTYTARITSGVKDQAGNALLSDYTWSFTTVGGSLDTSFVESGVVVTAVSGGNDRINALAIQSDDRLIAAGIATSGLTSTVARYNPAGSLDTNFGNAGMVDSMVPGTMAVAPA